MASNKLKPKKMFSGDFIGKLITDAENKSKTIFESPESEFSLAFFLLVRKAFNDAYDRIKKTVATDGVAEIGNTFSGLTGSLVRGTHTERGGAKYQWAPTGGEEIDPEFVTAETKYKVNSKAVAKYQKDSGDLPPGVALTKRNKSMSLSPTNEAKALFESQQDDDSMLYDLEILEIEEK